MSRIKHLHAEEAASHERWLLSYSDFITLLFAFFVVLYATTYHDKQSIKKLSHAIHNGFQSMGAFTGDLPGSKGPYTGSTEEPADGPSELENDKMEVSEGSARAVADLQKLRKELEAAMGAELKNHEVVLQVTPEGFVISLKELGFFNSGQADPATRGRRQTEAHCEGSFPAGFGDSRRRTFRQPTDPQWPVQLQLGAFHGARDECASFAGERRRL